MKETSKDIGMGLGEVVEINSTAFTSEQARFIRIIIELPLDKPIRKGGGIVSSPEGDKIQLGFKYEWLAGLCFRCGCFGHEAKVCSKTTDQGLDNLPYSDWLKAGYR